MKYGKIITVLIGIFSLVYIAITKKEMESPQLFSLLGSIASISAFIFLFFDIKGTKKEVANKIELVKKQMLEKLLTFEMIEKIDSAIDINRSIVSLLKETNYSNIHTKLNQWNDLFSKISVYPALSKFSDIQNSISRNGVNLNRCLSNIKDFESENDQENVEKLIRIFNTLDKNLRDIKYSLQVQQIHNVNI